MRWRDGFDGFEFQDYAAGNNEIDAALAHRHTLVQNLDWNLASVDDAAQIKFSTYCLFINIFQMPGSKMSVHFNQYIYDNRCGRFDNIRQRAYIPRPKRHKIHLLLLLFFFFAHLRPFVSSRQIQDYRKSPTN